ncbi:hypothetical protein BUALT_Bualt09G0003100 [Buddleja alternifolia]|uniref:Uncharacterized protein n=1 Tax=Buddleja alternifolia TaxID=168488 RepID=A0AAV6WZE2_9LAMI|nr:hypothetical protein BUALT_Bualt09G0003100 [Buddleja alternifolia]
MLMQLLSQGTEPCRINKFCMSRAPNGKPPVNQDTANLITQMRESISCVPEAERTRELEETIWIEFMGTDGHGRVRCEGQEVKPSQYRQTLSSYDIMMKKIREEVTQEGIREENEQMKVEREQMRNEILEMREERERMKGLMEQMAKKMTQTFLSHLARTEHLAHREHLAHLVLVQGLVHWARDWFIGPGTGSLTNVLVTAGATVLAIEKDPYMAAVVWERFAGLDHVKGWYYPVFTSWFKDGALQFFGTRRHHDMWLMARQN